MMADVIKNMGRIDCAFNNAGIEGENATTEACSELNWQKTMDVNLRSVWLCMKYQLIGMSKNFWWIYCELFFYCWYGGIYEFTCLCRK